MEINHKPAKTIRGTKTFKKIKRQAYLLDSTKLLHKSLHIVSLHFFYVGIEQNKLKIDLSKLPDYNTVRSSLDHSIDKLIT